MCGVFGWQFVICVCDGLFSYVFVFCRMCLSFVVCFLGFHVRAWSCSVCRGSSYDAALLSYVLCLLSFVFGLFWVYVQSFFWMSFICCRIGLALRVWVCPFSYAQAFVASGW